jgi:hypothetical protein
MSGSKFKTGVGIGPVQRCDDFSESRLSGFNRFARHLREKFNHKGTKTRRKLCAFALQSLRIIVRREDPPTNLARQEPCKLLLQVKQKFVIHLETSSRKRVSPILFRVA